MAADLGAVALAVTPDLSGFGSDVEKGVDAESSSLESAGKKVGKAMAIGAAAAGAALEGFARSQAPLRESSQRIAASIGMSESALRDLAMEASNVTFPLDDVYASMQAGREQGLKSGKQLQEFASFWDVVGDATGEAGPELAKAGVALRAVGIAAGEESEAVAAMGFIHENTTGSISDFLSFIERTGPELRDMGADVDDAAAILGVLESEFGMTGRTARQEFRKAVTEADGDMGKMLQTLGISSEQFDTYRGKVAESAGVLERNADIHADSYTVMQKAQHWATELMHAHSGLFEVASGLATPLIGVGMAMGGIAQVGPAVVSGVGTAGKALGGFAKTAVTTTATVAKQVAVQVGRWVFLGAQSLIHAARVAAAWLLSIWPIAAVIAAVVGLVVLIVKNWETIKRVIAAGWEWVRNTTRRLWDAITGFLSRSVDNIKRGISAGWEWVKATTSRVWNAILGFMKTLWGFTLPGLIFNNLDKIKAAISTALGFIQRVWSTAWTAAKNFVADRITDVVNFVKSLPQRAKDALLLNWQIYRGYWDSIFNAVRDFVRDRATDMVALVTDLPSRLKTGLQSTWQTFWGHWKRIATAVKTFVKDRIDDVVDFFKKLPKRILDALGNLGKKLADKFKFKLPGISFSGAGDGPGAPPGGGGTALRKVQSAIGRHSGASISSTYRDPVHNRRVGGSPTSYHLDRLNPAVDIVAPSAAILDRVYADLVRIGGWRELLWRVPNHAPGDNMHIHAAHTGGRVTERGIEPLRRDELLSKLQVGETVLPRDWDGGSDDLLAEVRALRAEVRRQTDRHTTMTRTR